MAAKEKVKVRKGSKLWQEEVVEDLSLCLPRLVLQGTEEDIVVEAALKSKSLYKVELYLLKIMPMIIALAYLVNTVSSYLGY